MCGICGIVNANPAEMVEPGIIRRMCDTIAHRGPDDYGFITSGSMGLGMRRLSIIDLEKGKQPIHNEDSMIQLVFNGEIYNYRELRSALEARGHAFYTQSDTEVVVHAYEEYGDDCVNELRGMFGLALWDSRQEVLLLAVDRFGIKPLYCAATSQGIVFGSELKCLLASEMVAQEMDFEALAQYLTLGYIPAPATVFQGVRKLQPGYLLHWTPTSGVAVRRYWDLPHGQLEHYRSPSETRRQLRDALKDSVQSHLISDVPLGAFLSGGIDSSIIVALMSELSTQPVKTFSIGFADRDHNELEYARLVADRYGTDHHEFIVEPEAVDVLPRLVTSFGEPFADSSALPTFYLSKIARQFVKVALSGDGGDEMFLGYPIFRGLELARYAQILPMPVRQAMAALPAILPRWGNAKWNDRLAHWSKRATDSTMTPDEAYRSKLTKIGLPIVSSLLTREFRDCLNEHNPYRFLNECVAHRSNQGQSHPLERFVYAGLKVSLAGDILVKVDRTSMANSLEVRVPLLDHRLAEFIATIPISQRLPGWRLKGLLKDTFAEALPPRVLSHAKHGFTVPLAAWFRGDLVSFASDVLLSDEARQRGLMDMAAVEAALSRHRRGARDFGTLIWALLILELWCREMLPSRRTHFNAGARNLAAERV